MSETRVQVKPHLELELRHRIGPLALAVELCLTQPWTVLFGPSGSGKTTILRAVGGLIRPEHARIVLRDPVSSECQIAADTAAGVFISPHRRRVRWSAQRPALFPHLTVRENLRCALDASSSSANRHLDDAVAHFHLTALAESRPAGLSGGERQMVAVARAAIAAQGCLLMLDEPFSGLDARLRDRLLEDLRGWLRPARTPVLSVTHDVGEAFELADEVVRIAQGRIVDQGPAAAVLATERDRLIAQLTRGGMAEADCRE